MEIKEFFLSLNLREIKFDKYWVSKEKVILIVFKANFANFMILVTISSGKRLKFKKKKKNPNLKVLEMSR